jgi:hypothetical protein
MNLSKHVTKSEFERSEKAISLGISNEMNEAETRKAIDLCVNVFEPIREHLGLPIKINSGFRSQRVNKLVGGASSSQHTKAEAMDLALGDGELFDWIKENVEYDQLIKEFPTPSGGQSWIHISYRKGNNRKQALRAIKRGGKTVYIPYTRK